MRYLFILFFSLCSAVLSARQSHDFEKEKVRVSVKAGWQNTSITGSDAGFLAVDGKLNAVNSYRAGVAVDNPLGRTFAFKHELFFHNSGSRFVRRMHNQDFDARLDMHTIQLNPLSVVWRIKNVHVFGGPYTAVLLNASVTAITPSGEKFKDKNIYGVETDDQDGSYYLQKMDVGVMAGAEYHFEFGGLIGVQLSRGFAGIYDNSNTYENQGPSAPADLKLFNRSFSVYAGYRF